MYLFYTETSLEIQYLLLTVAPELPYASLAPLGPGRRKKVGIRREITRQHVLSYRTGMVENLRVDYGEVPICIYSSVYSGTERHLQSLLQTLRM